MSGPRLRIRWRFFSSRVFVGLVFVRQGHRSDGAFEFGQVVIDRRLQDRMSGVKVAAGQVIAHAGDLAPWDVGLGVEQLGGRSTSSSGRSWPRATPAASIKTARVGSAGRRCPDSYALIMLCVTPARAASSAWDSPAPGE